MRKIHVKYGTLSHLAAYACQQNCEFVLNLSLVVKSQNTLLDFPLRGICVKLHLI